MNGEYQVIAKQLDKANTEFREFERKDIKYRWGGAGGRVGGTAVLVLQQGGLARCRGWFTQLPLRALSRCPVCAAGRT